MRIHFRTLTSRAGSIGMIAFFLALLLSSLTPSAQAVTEFGTPTRFSPDKGHSLFPGGNLNVFKQFVISVDKSERVGKTVQIDPLFNSLEFGGELSARVLAAFGIEVGLCFDLGTADFDLGFRPSITLPDRYPSEIPLRLTVAEGLLDDSKFTTTFDPLAQAYADLVFELSAALKAKACVFGCTDALDFSLSTCDIPPLPLSGIDLVKESARCDKALVADTFCSIELASFNREDNKTLRMLNVGADSREEFFIEPYKEFGPPIPTDSERTFTVDTGRNILRVEEELPNLIDEKVKVSSSGTLPGGLKSGKAYYVTNLVSTELQLSKRSGGTAIEITDNGTGTHTISLSILDELLDGKYGKLSIDVPAVTTDSSESDFNTAEVLKSSGSENIMGIGIDVAAMLSDFLSPPPNPPLADAGGSSPIYWDYTLASLTLGPAVKLQTDFEMTWDLEVSEITFSEPGTLNPREVRIWSEPNGILGEKVARLTDVADPGTFHLTNSGPKALPEIELITTDPPLPVEVIITYVLKPKLKTVVSTPFIGQLDYKVLAAAATIDRVGRLGFGPLLEGTHKFKFGEFTVFDDESAPKSGAGKVGTIKFQMKAAGRPRFVWTPAQLKDSTFDWSEEINDVTNWLEFISKEMNSYPGAGGNTGSDVLIAVSPFPTLYESVEIATIKIGAARLNIMQRPPEIAAPELTVGGGMVDNSGTINAAGISAGSSLKLDSPDAVLSGPGTLQLSNGASLRGYTGTETFTFSNFNTIRGVGEAMDQYSVNTNSTINNVGKFIAEDGPGILSTSAGRIVNQSQGVFESRTNTDCSIYGDEFESRVGSRVAADELDSETYMSFDKAEHAGLIRASNGGLVSVGPWNAARATWNAGQSFTNDVGFFRAEGTGSVLQLIDVDMKGGCFVLGSGGSLEAEDTNFDGSVLHIGDFNALEVKEMSGFLTLDSPNHVFTNVSLTNYGTVSVPGQAEFIGNIIFANNGTVKVPAGGRLQIKRQTILTPGASDEALSQPGAANATHETLAGGTWDIAGTLDFEGASFTAIGANAARASTRSASIDKDGGEAGNAEDDKSRILSLGNPAKVILRGADWSFPALESLRENRGTLRLVEAAFPGGASGGSTPDDFTNKGELLIEKSSALNVGGIFIQTGARAKTELISGGGALTSAENNFQIIGGQVIASADAQIFNRTGDTITTGTTVRVESPMIDTSVTDYFGQTVFEQVPVSVEYIGNNVQITTIAQGADVTIHGAAVRFPALTENLASNAGTFTLSGDGIDNAPRRSLGLSSFHAITNTGQVNVLGYTSELQTGDYTQNGAASATRIGAGANLILSGGLVINGGEMVVEIASRPRENQFGKIKASRADFGDKLVIDFTGELADPSASVDIGDTWEIIPRTSSAPITGVDTNTVAYRLDGALLPADWLPAGSHLAVIQFNTNFGKRGLGIRVVPEFGFKDYDTWAADNSLPTNFLANPFQVANDNGIINGQEFLFGSNGADGKASFQFVTGADGKTYLQLSYVRPSGTEHRDATYTPYYSRDMVDWFVASMFVTDIRPGPGLNLQWVTLQSSFPIIDDGMYFRVQANFNPENFEEGVIPEKPQNWSGGLENLHYEVGQVLYFNINARADFGSVYGTDTYRDRSALSSAVVHAGVLENFEHGIVKVTILPRQDSFTGSTQNEVTSESFTYSGPGVEPNAISYRIEKGEDIIVANAFQGPPEPEPDSDCTYYIIKAKDGNVVAFCL